MIAEPVNTVVIKPLVVEIKAIKIGNKQMTQSIFKQLRKRDLIKISSPDYYFVEESENIKDLVYNDGHVWGWVNFTIGNNSRHVVYENEGDLFRCGIDDTIAIDRAIYARDQGYYCDETQISKRNNFRIIHPRICSVIKNLNLRILLQTDQLFIAV